MTNTFTVAVVLFTLETNWVPLATITPIPTGRSNYNSTVRQIEEAEVWRVKWFVNNEDGRELKVEAKREAVALTNQLLRVVPTNFPPSAIFNLPLRTLVHRQDAAPIPVPPLPPGPRKNRWDEEVTSALAGWAEHNRTHKLIPLNAAAIDQASAAYARNPSAETAGELLALIKLFSTEPVP